MYLYSIKLSKMNSNTAFFTPRIKRLMLNKQSEMTDDNRAQTVFVERKPSLEASVLGGFNVSRMELRNEASTD